MRRAPVGPPCIIYGLTDPRTSAVRYIGQSSKGLARPRGHSAPFRLAGDVGHKANWIRGLLVSGLRYEIQVLEVVKTPADLDAAECFWIAQGYGLGWPLTNLSVGGDGARGCVRSEETRAKMRSAATRFRPVIDSNGNIHANSRAAALATGVAWSAVRAIVGGERRQAHGIAFRRFDGIDTSPAVPRPSGKNNATENRRRSSRLGIGPVVGAGLVVFDSARDAAKWIGVDPCVVRRSVKTGLPSRDGFSFARFAA